MARGGDPRRRRAGVRPPARDGAHDGPIPPLRGYADPALARSVRALARGFPGVCGVFVQDLRTGAGAAWNARARFPAASTLKLAIAVELLRGLRGIPAPGTRQAALLWRMLVYSDDRSANELLEAIGGSTSGGSARVNAMMHELGMADSDMYGGYIVENALARSPIPLEIFARPSFIGKATTAWDMARLERALHLAAGARGALVWGFPGGFTPGDARYLLYLLANARTRGGLTYVSGAGVTVLHKAGWITKARHDTGLVYSRDGAFVVTVLTWNGGGVGSASDVLACAGRSGGAEPIRRLMRRLVPRLLQGNLVFRRFWLGQTISLFGDQITMIAIPLAAVLVLDANATQMGYLIAAELVPNLFLALHAGAWVDRHGGRRRIMIATDLGRGALIATIPLAYAFDALTFPHLYIGGVPRRVHDSVLPRLVQRALRLDRPPGRLRPGELLPRGQPRLLVGRRAERRRPPRPGFKAPFALAVDAVTYLVSALFLSSISPKEPPTEEAERGHVVAGMRFLWSNASMRASLLGAATINLFNYIFWAVFILYVVRTLHIQPGTLGLVLGAAAVGSLIGSLVTTRIGRRIGIGPTYMLGSILFPVPLVLVPLADGPKWLVLAMLFSRSSAAGSA